MLTALLFSIFRVISRVGTWERDVYKTEVLLDYIVESCTNEEQKKVLIYIKNECKQWASAYFSNTFTSHNNTNGAAESSFSGLGLKQNSLLQDVVLVLDRIQLE